MVGPVYTQIPKKYKVPGAKAVLKAIDKGIVAQVLVAEDAETHVVSDVLARAKQMDIEVNWVSSMKELGEFCGINVGASCCAILKSWKGG